MDPIASAQESGGHVPAPAARTVRHAFGVPVKNIPNDPPLLPQLLPAVDRSAAEYRAVFQQPGADGRTATDSR